MLKHTMKSTSQHINTHTSQHIQPMNPTPQPMVGGKDWTKECQMHPPQPSPEQEADNLLAWARQDLPESVREKLKTELTAIIAARKGK